MSLLDSAIAPYVFLLAGAGVMFAIARRLLLKLLIFFVVQLILLALFPKLLVAFVDLVSRIAQFIPR
jgi:hypothetical protein